ncbi:MAG: protease inhibitor I42 family protein [Clostridiales bacterium]|jgi:predicted secreted protein|nr:protease inhibitor I42 family protein [Clostridiales bacterium]
MKKTLLIALLAAMALSLFGCRKKPEISFVDTLPCDQVSGYTWVARASSGDTGQVYVEQTYRDDETYELLGASGVLENAFSGVVPGVATVRLYYVHETDWDGYNSSAEGTAYYEFLIYEDLTISLLYSEVELPDSF